MTCMLAAARSKDMGDVAGDVFPWLAALAVLVIVGFLLAALVRRRFQSGGDGGAEMLTLHDYRRLRDEGEISEDEFQRIRTGIIAAAKGSRGSEKAGEADGTGADGAAYDEEQPDGDDGQLPH